MHAWVFEKSTRRFWTGFGGGGGLDASGLTPLGAKRLTAQLIRQIRFIVRDPVYMTGTSHNQVLAKWSLLHPIEALKSQLNKETSDPRSQAWQRVMDTFNMPPSSSQLRELPTRKTGIPCPECGVYFDTCASLLSHMSKQHKDHAARPVNQPKREFDKHTDALGGLPRCSHCHVKLCDFSSLFKHINEHRCRVLFPTQPLTETPAPPHPNPHESPSHDTHAIIAVPDKPNSPPAHTQNPHSHPPSPPRESMYHSNVPTPTEPPPSPHLGPTTLTTQEDGLPYFRRPHVQELLIKHSENAAFRLQDRRWLRHYCALCSQ